MVIQSIFSGALNAPSSPLVPHTPFRSSTTPASVASPSILPPRTPYTPFTSFALKTPFQSSYGLGTVSNSPYAHFLDDNEDPLARLYSQILRFVERDMSRIMGIADKVSLKHVSTGRKDKALVTALVTMPVEKSNRELDEDGFEIMANVVWEEFGRAIMDELGPVVFAAGRPNEFRKVSPILDPRSRSFPYIMLHQAL